MASQCVTGTLGACDSGLRETDECWVREVTRYRLTRMVSRMAAHEVVHTVECNCEGNRNYS